MHGFPFNLEQEPIGPLHVTDHRDGGERWTLACQKLHVTYRARLEDVRNPIHAALANNRRAVGVPYGANLAGLLRGRISI